MASAWTSRWRERRFAMLLLTSLRGARRWGSPPIGIYGVMAYLVSQGTRELGIRLALGATPRDVLRAGRASGGMVALAGVAAGLAGAFVLTRFMQAMLFGTASTDPLTFT